VDKRGELRAILTRIKDGPKSLRWVADETGIPESKLRSFVGNDLLAPESRALTDEEVQEVMGWYFFGDS
jgi:hypothetical protein